MVWVDYLILAIVLVAALIGFFRGFSRMTVSLITWVLAVWAAVSFAQPAADMFPGWIAAAPSVRLAVFFGAIFLGILILGALVNVLLGKLIAGSFLKGPDRILGVIMGTALGLVIVTGAVLLGGLTPIPEDPWWQNSYFIPTFEQWALWLVEYLPEDVQQNLQFDAPPPPPLPPAPGEGA